MHNGDQVLYRQELAVEQAKRTGILVVLHELRLKRLQLLATAPERHPHPVRDCEDCLRYGRCDSCDCVDGKEPDPTFHCGVEGCYQCEIWPLQ